MTTTGTPQSFAVPVATATASPSAAHLSVGGGDGQPVVGQRRREAGADGRAGDAIGVRVFAITAAQRALVLQGALGDLRRPLAGLRLAARYRRRHRRRVITGCRVDPRPIAVRAEVGGVQAVPWGGG